MRMSPDPYCVEGNETPFIEISYGISVFAYNYEAKQPRLILLCLKVFHVFS